MLLRGFPSEGGDQPADVGSGFDLIQAQRLELFRLFPHRRSVVTDYAAPGTW
jgi:hypothetical protein